MNIKEIRKLSAISAWPLRARGFEHKAESPEVVNFGRQKTKYDEFDLGIAKATLVKEGRTIIIELFLKDGKVVSPTSHVAVQVTFDEADEEDPIVGSIAIKGSRASFERELKNVIEQSIAPELVRVLGYYYFDDQRS